MASATCSGVRPPVATWSWAVPCAAARSHAQVAQRGLGARPEQGAPAAVGADAPRPAPASPASRQTTVARRCRSSTAPCWTTQPPAGGDHQRLRRRPAQPRRRAAPRRGSGPRRAPRRRARRPSRAGRSTSRVDVDAAAPEALRPAEARRWSCRYRAGRRARRGRARSPQRRPGWRGSPRGCAASSSTEVAAELLEQRRRRAPGRASPRRRRRRPAPRRCRCARSAR